MERNTKDWIQYGSAVGMLITGVALTFLCFFLNQYDINDSVLLYVAQCLVYAGSIFGVSIYIRSKIGEVKNDIESRILGKNETEEGKGKEKAK